MRRHLLLGIACLQAAAFMGSGAVAADEITLKAVSAFPEGTRFSRNFERFVEKVNAEGKGLVQIRYLGGGKKVMSAFEVGNAVRKGVVDIGNTTGAFYTNLMPEADALKLTEMTIQEQRKSGAWDYLNKLHNEKVNAQYLARIGDGMPFHIYLTKKIEQPDLSGLKIRVTPIYRNFVTAMGGTSVRTAPGEVFTALERGVVDGYGWPSQGIHDLGWHEVTKFRIDPGFYQVDVGVLVNLDRWKGLSDDQRAFLAEQADWLEGLNGENGEINKQEAAKQADSGVQVITFPPEQARKYGELARKAGWEALIENNPETGPKLKEMLTRK